MKKKKIRLWAGAERLLNAVLAAGVVLVALAASAFGQASPQLSAPDTAQTAGQIQGRTIARGRKPFRAARLTFITGDVLVEQANSTSKDQAVLNMPLVEGAVVTTGEDGQAEVEFEDGSLARLTPNSGVSLINMSVDGSGNYQTRAGVISGQVYLELRAGTKYQYSVDAGGDVITPIENSTIRVNFDESPAVIAVLDGSAHIAAVTGTSDVDAVAGQTARMDAPSEGGTYLIKQAITSESWDQWNEDRDQSAASEAGSQTAARSQFAGDQGYGWSDLDANGNWYDVPGQGEVWQPSIAEDADAGASGFDPYGSGSWVWSPAGYTWASGYGWGWLPYRCGQWSWWNGFGWGWQPAFSCGVFGFGGYGYGGIGFNIGRPPGFWHRPRRPIVGSGPVHPILRVRVGPIFASPVYGTGRVTTVKSIAGNSLQPLARIGGGYTPRGGSALGSGLQRDYPISASTHDPVMGNVATHDAPRVPVGARMPWEPAGSTAPRSHILPAQPRAGYSTQQRVAPVSRPAPAPVSRPAPAPRSSSPAASHASSSPHK